MIREENENVKYILLCGLALMLFTSLMLPCKALIDEGLQAAAFGSGTYNLNKFPARLVHKIWHVRMQIIVFH